MRTIRRMPRVQVYLPEDLYRELKAHKLPASELLQEAVRRELNRRDKREELRRYLEETEAEVVGELTPEEAAEIDAMVARIVERERRLRGRP